MMRLNFVSPDFFLPFESVKLGRFITSVGHPHQDYHDPHYTEVITPTVTIRAQFNDFRKGSTSRRFATSLTSLLSSAFSKRTNTQTRITTEEVKTYLLENSQPRFKEAMGLEPTKTWVEKAIDNGDDIYMVVGIHTVTNARLTQELVVEKENSGEFSVPITLSLTAIGLHAPFGNIIDPLVEGHRNAADGTKVEFLAPGEQICAFQYRKIRHQWLSSRSVNNASLSKYPHWVTSDKWRDDNAGEEDIIVVELIDPDKFWDQEEVVEEDILAFQSYTVQ